MTESMQATTFAERLTAGRKAAGLSQSDLAARLQVSRQAVSKWERGDALPSAEIYGKLALLLPVSMDELITGAPFEGSSSMDALPGETFGQRLTALRQGLSLSREGLAELLSVSRQSVSKWERGEAYPDGEKLILLARTAGIPLSFLFPLPVKEEEKEANGTDKAKEPAHEPETDAPPVAETTVTGETKGSGQGEASGETPAEEIASKDAAAWEEAPAIEQEKVPATGETPTFEEASAIKEAPTVKPKEAETARSASLLTETDRPADAPVGEAPGNNMAATDAPVVDAQTGETGETDTPVPDTQIDLLSMGQALTRRFSRLWKEKILTFPHREESGSEAAKDLPKDAEKSRSPAGRSPVRKLRSVRNTTGSTSKDGAPAARETPRGEKPPQGKTLDFHTIAEPGPNEMAYVYVNRNDGKFRSILPHLAAIPVCALIGALIIKKKFRKK